MPAITLFRGDYHFLSNFYERPFLYGGIEWASGEHMYQAGKATTQPALDHIRTANTPGEAKRRGRGIVVRPDWDQISRFHMLKVVTAKFGDPDMMTLLRNTGALLLIEGNTWGDTYWGAVNEGKRGWDSPGLPSYFQPGLPEYRGHNWLGRVLMHVREVIS